MKLAWKAPVFATAAYAAWLAVRGVGPLADEEALPAEMIGALEARLLESRIPADRFGAALLAWAGIVEERRLAVERTLADVGATASSPHELAADLDRLLAGVESGLLAVRPKLVEELTLRTRPMREAWETIGPGLTLALFREIGMPGPSPMTVVIVHPFRGGGGAAHPRAKSATWEGMLAHPHPDLPETLRLAWLLAQAAAPSSATDADEERVVASAALPATLAAGEAFDLCRCDEATIRRAADVWLAPDRLSEAAVAGLWAWWRDHQERRPPWETALVALEQSMPSS